ncbi:MAG: AAA-like domain-containing protein, partial [Treponema sp.]|nr:AAA-like domain-containing protein [Treponema sp.]
MERRFNYTGLCVPEQHYMVDISAKIAQIRAMVDQGLYFTINRARQYGKTTTLFALWKALSTDYLCIDISFEGVGDVVFEDESKFCQMFLSEIQRRLKRSQLVDDKDYIASWVDPSVVKFDALRDHLDKVCAGRRIVLMIDEVDASTNYRVYIRFLAMLRDKYLV